MTTAAAAATTSAKSRVSNEIDHAETSHSPSPRSTSTSLIDPVAHATMITKALTLACVIAAALVQTQRTSPAQFALGGTVDECNDDTWSDGPLG